MILRPNYGILKSVWYNSNINHDERTSSGLGMERLSADADNNATIG